MSEMASGIRALMNPKRVLRQREEEAGLGMNVPQSEMAPEKPAPRPMTQSEFFRGSEPEKKPEPATKQGGPAAKDKPAEPKPKRGFMDMFRRKKADEVAMADEFEGEWRKGSDEPLTDALRAGRAKLAERGEAERDEYETAFKGARSAA